ncbi:MAG: Crp/Fnr family transcriptional regulator [Acidobacteriaceae bacterium]|jgi:CRP/FNR family transcriptional regulator
MPSSGDTGTSKIPRSPNAGEFFNSIPAAVLQDFLSIVVPVYYPDNALLFQEQQAPTRILILLEGYAKLSVNSHDGKRMILWVARPGELLGLSSVVSGSTHKVTAETLQQCQIASVPSQEFLDFLVRHPAIYQSVARELSLEMNRACEQMRIVGLSSSAAVRVARLLLEWSAGGKMTDRGTRVSISLTHGEMGECIGAARETVSRAVADLRQRCLIDVHGSTLFVTNRFALEAYARVSAPDPLHAAVSRANRLSPLRMTGIPSRVAMEMSSRIKQDLNWRRKSYRPAVG